MNTQLAEKAYRADLKRQYKRRHRKGIGLTAHMKVAEIYRDLYVRRTDPETGKPIAREFRPGKAWTRRRLEHATSLRENAFVIIALS